MTLAAVPGARAGDLVYAFVFWLAQSSATIPTPANWTLEDSIDDGFEGHGAAFRRVVGPGESITEHDFPLPTPARAGGVLVTLGGVRAPPQHIVAARAQSLSSSAFEVKVPGLDIAEPGHLLLVLASTHGDPQTPLQIQPPIRSVASVGRLAVFAAPLGAGQTGEYAVQDTFVALRATLTFMTVLRPSRP